MSTLSVTVIQTDIHWEDKAANLAMFEEKIFSINGKAEVIVLPEMFSTGFSMQPTQLAEPMDGETINWMRKVSMQKKIILTGSVIIEEEKAFYNRLIWMLPDGNFGYYDKRHLFAYAGEDAHYTPGRKRLVASVKGFKINLQVCYDLRFPVWSRQQRFRPDMQDGATVAPEFDVLIYVANWPEKRSHAWKTLLQARAIENQCYVVGVNRIGYDGTDIHHAGDSMIIDPLGEIMYHRTNQEDIHTEILHKEKLDEVRTRFPFWKDADQFFIEP